MGSGYSDEADHSMQGVPQQDVAKHSQGGCGSCSRRACQLAVKVPSVLNGLQGGC